MRDCAFILMYVRADVTWDIYAGDRGLIFAESDPDRGG